MKRVTICRWLGHKRYPLDDSEGNIVNVDGCRRCGVILRGKRGKSSRWLRTRI
jgi:hypothetical protein